MFFKCGFLEHLYFHIEMQFFYIYMLHLSKIYTKAKYSKVENV